MAFPKINSALGKGLAIGLGAAVLVPVVAPVVAKAARPLLKNGVKTGLIMYEKAKIVGAEAKEAMEDLAAEAKAELINQQRAAASAARAAGEKK